MGAELHLTHKGKMARLVDGTELGDSPIPLPAHAPLSRRPLRMHNKAGASVLNRENLGYFALFGTALLWGSWTPSLRLLYQAKLPPDPPLLNALQAVLSAFFLITANLASNASGKAASEVEHDAPLLQENADGKAALNHHDPELGAHGGAPAPHAAPEEPPWRAPRNALDKALAGALNWRSTSLWVAGGEVGLWMCLAFGLEVAGVQLTSATKTAFLNQVSMLITPLLVYLGGHEVRFIEWLACGLGLLGSGLVAVDALNSGEEEEPEAGEFGGAQQQGWEEGHEGSMRPDSEVMGLLLIMTSAFFFALATVRLGRYSALFDSLKLSTAAAISLGIVSVAWVFCGSIGKPGGLAKEATIVRYLLLNSSTLSVLLWLGIGPGAIASFLQASGQKVVPAAQAQVIYSTTPLWSAAVALLVLDARQEAMGLVAWLGASIMLGSSILVAVTSPSKSLYH